MLIEYAILALLWDHPMTGYDLKKVMVDSCYLYWSGNNNQIYKALLELVGKGYLSASIVHQESGPSKKVYTVTPDGRTALSAYLDSTQPELPEFRKPFLVQLAIAAVSGPEHMESLLIRYREELSAQRLLYQERQRRKQGRSVKAEIEAWLDRMMADNRDLFYQTELEWVDRTLKEHNKQYRTEGL